jgi:hypothetical protein
MPRPAAALPGDLQRAQQLVALGSKKPGILDVDLPDRVHLHEYAELYLPTRWQ